MLYNYICTRFKWFKNSNKYRYFPTIYCCVSICLVFVHCTHSIWAKYTFCCTHHIQCVCSTSIYMINLPNEFNRLRLSYSNFQFASTVHGQQSKDGCACCLCFWAYIKIRFDCTEKHRMHCALGIVVQIYHILRFHNFPAMHDIAIYSLHFPYFTNAFNAKRFKK